MYLQNKKEELRFMNNYEHKIICPDNCAIRKYLWEDNFHDSNITNIKFDKVSVLIPVQAHERHGEPEWKYQANLLLL